MLARNLNGSTTEAPPPRSRLRPNPMSVPRPRPASAPERRQASPAPRRTRGLNYADMRSIPKGNVDWDHLLGLKAA